MNTPSPLIPQGVTPAKGKTSFFFKVLMILTVHVVVIGGMLLQGCKDTKDTSGNSQDTANSSDTMPPATNPSTVSNSSTAPTTATPPAQGYQTGAPGQPAPVPGGAPAPAPGAITQQPPGGMPATGAPGAPAFAPAPPPQPVQATAPTEIPGTGKEYIIVSGDTLGAVAHRNGVSLKALLEANPGVNPKKLQVGQKIQVPAGTGATAGAGTEVAASGDETVYTVKSGDTLSKIAKANHTTFKKIMAMNDLKTTAIKVGQKLKLPAPKAAGAETATPTATAVPQPVSQPVPPPTAPTGGPVTLNQ